MTITDHQLNEFIEIYRKRFGVVLEKEEALRKALDLIRLVKILYQPKKNEHEKYKEEV